MNLSEEGDGPGRPQVVRMTTGGEAVEQRGGQLLVAEDSHSLGARSLKWNEAHPAAELVQSLIEPRAMSHFHPLQPHYEKDALWWWTK